MERHGNVSVQPGPGVSLWWPRCLNALAVCPGGHEPVARLDAVEGGEGVHKDIHWVGQADPLATLRYNLLHASTIPFREAVEQHRGNGRPIPARSLPCLGSQVVRNDALGCEP